MNGSRLPVHVIHEQILAERMRRGEVCLAPANLSHLLDETNQIVISRQHERVDENPLLPSTAHLFQSAADHQRIEAKPVPIDISIVQRQG